MATSKENVRAKVLTVLDEIRPHLEEKLEILLDSGAINFEKEDDNWLLPKVILRALAQEIDREYKRCTYKYEKRIDRFYYEIHNVSIMGGGECMRAMKALNKVLPQIQTQLSNNSVALVDYQNGLQELLIHKGFDVRYNQRERQLVVKLKNKKDFGLIDNIEEKNSYELE